MHLIFQYFGLLICPKMGKEEKIDSTMAFEDSQLASATNSAKSCSDGPGRLHCLAGYL